MAAPRSEPSLRSLYDACAPAAFRRARALLGSDADAWDVVHQVFCRLAEGERASAIGARPMTYVYRATTNACLDELEARRRRAGLRLPDSAGQSPPGDRLHARDLLEKLAPRLDALDRRILVLAVLDELPQEQIAEVLGVWRRTVGRRLARLRALIGELEQPPLQRSS